eukprot:6181564-Pleurochrysis_carterae.AAC.2
MKLHDHFERDCVARPAVVLSVVHHGAHHVAALGGDARDGAASLAARSAVCACAHTGGVGLALGHVDCRLISSAWQPQPWL